MKIRQLDVRQELRVHHKLWIIQNQKMHLQLLQLEEEEIVRVRKWKLLVETMYKIQTMIVPLQQMVGNHAVQMIARAVAMNLKQKRVEKEALILLQEQKHNAKRVATILLQGQSPTNLAVRLLIGIAVAEAIIILLTTTVLIVVVLVVAAAVHLVAEAHLAEDVEVEIKNNRWDCFSTKKIILLKAGGAARLELPAFVIPYSHEKRLNRIHKSKTYSTMKSKILNCIVAFSFIALTGNAQTPADALRLSIAQPYGGTARTMGVSGAMGALGADYSAIGINPAGLASFRTSEFIITAGYTSVSTDAVLYNKEKPNNVVNDGNAKFYLNNCAFVRARRPEGGNWTTQNWSIGFSRLKTFDASFYFKGESKGSLVNRMQEKANTKQTKLNEFEEQLALETGAIYTKKNDPSYFASDFDGYPLELITKSQQGLSSGRVGQVDFSYAAN
jgi:hypothetical protein